MTDIEQVRDYQEWQAQNTAEARRDFMATWALYEDGLLDQDAMLDQLGGLVWSYGELEASTAAAWYDRLRAKTPESARYGAFSAEPQAPPYGASRSLEMRMNRDGWTRDQLWKHAAAMISNTGKKTIVDATRKDPANPQYASVPRGRTCAFCIMLASRGFVYSKRALKTDEMWHGDCNCQPVPQWGPGSIKGYNPSIYEDIYNQALQESDGSRKGTLAKIDEMGFSTHSPETAIPLDRKDPAYWAKRQQMLNIETNGEVLEPREVLFCERFLEQGESFEWIARPQPDPDGRRASSSDFRWLSLDDQVWELKSPTKAAKWRTIKHDLYNAANPKNGVPKTRIILDLGASDLSSLIRMRLNAYNAASTVGTHLDRVFVLYTHEKEQVLEEIDIA